MNSKAGTAGPRGLKPPYAIQINRREMRSFNRFLAMTQKTPPRLCASALGSCDAATVRRCDGNSKLKTENLKLAMGAM